MHYGRFHHRRFGIIGLLDRCTSFGVVEIAIRDYWIFQKRDALKPWAILIVKEYDKRIGKTATTLDYTFYHEDIANPEHQISELCVYYENPTEYVDHFCSLIAEYSPVTSQDRIQLIQEITKILLD